MLKYDRPCSVLNAAHLTDEELNQYVTNFFFQCNITKEQKERVEALLMETQLLINRLVILESYMNDGRVIINSSNPNPNSSKVLYVNIEYQNHE